jgi:hypothetical protein
VMVMTGRVLSLAITAATATAMVATSVTAQAPPLPSSQPSAPPCRVLKVDGPAFIARCGDRLSSFALVIEDISRVAASDSHGRFGFVCPIELMCEDKPEIFGWFIEPQTWQQGARDEWAIAELLTSRPWAPLQSVPKSSCELFDVTLGDMKGRGVCYEFPEMQLSVILMVAADDNAGFALVYQQREIGVKDLHDKVMQRLSRVQIERGSGDRALLRWMR